MAYQGQGGYNVPHSQHQGGYGGGGGMGGIGGPYGGNQPHYGGGPGLGGGGGGGMGGNMGGGPQNQDFFKFQNVSPEMLQFGLSTGQDLLNKQKDRFMPGVSGFWNSLKIYFAVSNTYVKSKLLILIYPIRHKSWVRELADEYQPDNKGEHTSHKFALPKQDKNAPDLYIPLMSFITYVLLFGLCKGLESGFTPEVLINAIWRCLILQCVECLVIKFGLSLMSVPLPFLDIFAYTGYKYVGLCINTVARFFGTTFNFISSTYMSLMLAYFVLKSLAAVVPIQATGPPRHLMLLAFAGIQFFVALILCWL